MARLGIVPCHPKVPFWNVFGAIIYYTNPEVATRVQFQHEVSTLTTGRHAYSAALTPYCWLMARSMKPRLASRAGVMAFRAEYPVAKVTLKLSATVWDIDSRSEILNDADQSKCRLTYIDKALLNAMRTWIVSTT